MSECKHGCSLDGICSLCNQEKAAIDPYNVTIGGVRADPFRIARAYGITDHAIFKALNSILRCGRKHKDAATDIADAIKSLQRWQEMEKEDASK